MCKRTEWRSRGTELAIRTGMSTNKKSAAFNRRDFLKNSIAVGVVASLPQSAAATSNESRYPTSQQAWLQLLQKKRIPYDGLVTSLRSENHYECAVRGTLPADLSGTLFRAGPGIFDRGNQRRRMVIDADGMIRRFQIHNGKAVFTNRHVRTEKFVAEERAGRYIYPSFSMMIPTREALVTNSIMRIKNQASVTAFTFGGRLFVTDEIQALTELGIQSLQTRGEVKLTKDDGVKFMAHSRITEFGGQKRLNLAAYNPVNGALQVHTFNEDFKLVARSQEVKIPRSFHDWHATPDFFVFLLPPLYMNNLGLAKAIAGLSTIADAVEFRAGEHAQVLLIPRNNRPAKFMTLPETLDSWHAVNAYQQNDSEVVFDFVASKRRAPVASNNSTMTKITRGEMVQNGSLRGTGVYRAILDYDKNHLSYGSDYFKVHGVEMPTIDSRRAGKAYENAYFIAGQEGLDNQIVRLNVSTRESERYDFGAGRFVTEPIFAPGAGDNGYLLSEVYSHVHKRSYLAVFDAKNLKQGPLAEVWLKHHLPIGFHGFWQQG